MDGKATVAQDIEQTRQNHPDTIASYGEFTDNSISWGGANYGSIVLSKSKSIIIDDGIFDESRFSKAFCKTKKSDEEHYNNDNKLGKYNFGLTDSVVLLGDNAEMIHRFGPNDYKKTTFDIAESEINNSISENVKSLSSDEIKFFNDWQLINNPDYDIINGRGTILIITDLNRKNNQKTFIELSYFMQGCLHGISPN